jgi:hypothetical protein
MLRTGHDAKLEYPTRKLPENTEQKGVTFKNSLIAQPQSGAVYAAYVPPSSFHSVVSVAIGAVLDPIGCNVKQSVVGLNANEKQGLLVQFCVKTIVFD